MATRKNAAALRRTLKAMGTRLEEVDAAVIRAAESLASAVDADPGNASLWREYRAALATLMEAGIDDEAVSDDDIGKAVSAPVVDISKSRAAVNRSRNL